VEMRVILVGVFEGSFGEKIVGLSESFRVLGSWLVFVR
jgi:hypothetical protein